MKKLMVMGVGMLICLPLSVLAGSYTSSSFNMSFGYPGGWNLNEMKMPTAGDMAGRAASQSATRRFGGIQVTDPTGFRGDIAGQAVNAAVGTAQDTAVAGVSGALIESQMKKHMPKFMSVTLENTARPGTQIMVTGVEGMAAPAGTAGDTASSGSGGKSSCASSVEGAVWGGKSVKLATIRCPQGDEWQITSTATMRHSGADFYIVGMMTAPSDDMAAFNAHLKGAMQQIMSSTSFK